jgi:hypothetical protein
MDRHYKYLSVFFAASFVIVIFGFYKTYFVSLPSSPVAIHFHALFFILWYVLLFIQPWLINSKRYDLHKKLGKLSYLLVPLITISTLAVSRISYLKGAAIYTDSQRIGNLIFPFSQLIVFDSLYLLAILYVRKTAFHMRYMIACSVILLGPAIRRIFVHWIGMDPQPAANFAFILLFLVLVILFMYDWIHGHIYNPYLVAMIFLILFFVSYTYFPQSWIWQKICGKFVRVFY